MSNEEIIKRIELIRKELNERLDLLVMDLTVVPEERPKDYFVEEFELPGYGASVRFTEEDIRDRERLESMVEEEALQIFSSSGRRGRDLEEVRQNVRQGKIAELFLIENLGYTESDLKYHDLVNREGEIVEVKAYNMHEKPEYARRNSYVQKDIKKLKESWNMTKWYYLFRCKEGKYEFIFRVQIR